MKAKEFAQQYIDSDDKDKEIAKIARQFLDDYIEMGKVRNARSDSAFISLLNEFNNKWQTFSMIVNKKLPVTTPIRSDGFRNLIYLVMPEIKEYW